MDFHEVEENLFENRSNPVSPCRFLTRDHLGSGLESLADLTAAFESFVAVCANSVSFRQGGSFLLFRIVDGVTLST